MDKSKPCSKCGVTQPLENFRINRAAKDGRQSACKPCQRKLYEARAEHYKAKARAHRAEHINEIREKQRDYFKKNSEQIRLRARAWHHANKDRAKITKRKGYIRNRQRRIDYTRDWREINRDKAKISDNNSTHRRRARLNQANHFFIPPIELERLRRQPCVYCGSTREIEIDHVIPLVKGGSHGIGNLVSACMSCNRSKGGLFVMEWRKRESPEA